MHYSIRRYSPDDIDFMWEMLYQSLYVRDSAAPFPRAVLEQPNIAHYLSNFGQNAGDDALIACAAHGASIDDDPVGNPDRAREAVPIGAPIGAAWCRLMTAGDPGYGYLADDIPELGMAIVAEWRWRGVGRALLTELLERNPVMSLSVDADNAGAHKLYESLAFTTISTIDGTHTMLRDGTAFDRSR